MKRVPLTIGLATAYAGFYQLTPLLGVGPAVIIVLYLLSPIVVCYMAYVILKYGEPSVHTFEKRFYEDREERRLSSIPSAEDEM